MILNFKSFCLIVLIFINTIFIYSEEIVKKYFNCFFGGGRERIYSQNESDAKLNELQINDVNINININISYSIVKLRYNIKNTGNDKIKIKWAYPILCSNIEKEILIKNKSTIQNYKIQNNYNNYKISADNKEILYNIENSDLKELSLLFKTGDTSNIVTKSKEQEEKINSYFYSYMWYVSDIEFNKKESKIIEIEYIVPLYYNTIKLNKKNLYKALEDPALQYVKYIDGEMENYQSEKIFSFMFHTSYSKYEKKIEKLDIKLIANVIDQDYLKILPINCQKKNNKYYWEYKNFQGEEINNIFVKISSLYSENTINPFSIKVSPDNLIDKENNKIIINQNNELVIFHNNKQDINIKKIRIFTEAFTKRSEIRESNRPVEIEIEFSENPDFINSIKYSKKFSYKKYKKEMSKYASITLYNDKEIRCKYIKLKFLKLHEPNEPLLINDIQIIKFD